MQLLHIDNLVIDDWFNYSELIPIFDELEFDKEKKKNNSKYAEHLQSIPIGFC